MEWGEAVVLEKRRKCFRRMGGESLKWAQIAVRGKRIPLIVMRCGVVLWGFWSKWRETRIRPLPVSVPLFSVSERHFLFASLF